MSAETVTAPVTAPVTATGTEATQPAKVNMSNLIIAAFKASKSLDTPANDIVAAVKANSGTDVTVSLVNNVRKRLKDTRKERANGKTRRKPGRPRNPTTEPTPETPVSELDRMLEVKKFASSVGGLDALKGFISKLEVFVQA